MADDLKRWSEDATDAPSEMRELLQTAKSDLPSRAQLTGLEGKLSGLLDGPPAPPDAAPPEGVPAGPGASRAPALAKLGVLVTVGGLVAAGAWWSARETPEPAPTLTPPHETEEKVREDASSAPKAEAQEPGAAAAPSAKPSGAPVPPAPPRAASSPSPSHAKPTAQAPKPSEASLLDQARQALKSNPARALDLTRQHKHLYPDGTLSQEREVIAIEALSRLDEKQSAQRKAKEFSEKYPESAHQKKVDTTLKE